SGHVLWAKNFGSPATEYANGCAFDSDGNLYVTGQFAGDVDFGPWPLSATGFDAFVVKMSPSGDVLWATNLGGGPLEESASSVAIGPTGDLAVVGRRASVASPWTYGGFATMIDSATGKLMWPQAKNYDYVTTDGSTNVQLNGVAFLDDGAIVIAGAF